MTRRKSSQLMMLLALALAPLVNAAEPAPEFTLHGAKDEVRLSALRGQVVYLDFWASWCTPCRQSFPWMDAMQEKYGAQGLKVVAINLDKEEEKRQAFLDATPAHFTIAYDPQGEVAERYGVMGMPSSYLIGRDGTLHHSHIGFRDKDKTALEQQITQLLAEPQGVQP